ncbi:ABC transporter permease [bacterium]|nr:ABC transporter permease [bacterium]
MIRKFFNFLFSLAAIFILSRALIRSLPGDPLDSLLSETALTIPREKIFQDLNLHLSFFDACWVDLTRLLKGDLGYSLVSREPVLPLLIGKLAKTLALSGGALLISLAFAIPCGILCSYPFSSTRSRFIARIARLFAAVSVIVPIAWIGPILLYVFAVAVPWFEFRGSFLLACLALSVPLAGSWSRLIEVRTREEMKQPYFQASLARGVPILKAIGKHALGPSAGALLAILGSQLGALLAGSFIAEWIFDWPGMGVTWIQAILQRDYPVMEAATLLGASCCLLGVLVGDLLQRVWDPRQRGGASG